MPKTIWKYLVGAESYINMPDGAQVLTVQVQGNQAYLCAEVILGQSTTTPRHFITYSTGHDIPDNPGVYIGTFQLPDLDLMFHTYEVKP